MRAPKNIFNLDRDWLLAILSAVLLAFGLVMDFVIRPAWFSGPTRLLWYTLCYIPVGLPVLIRGVRLAFGGDLFTEFMLMSIATLGAFYIGEYPEGVAVMLFYSIGELFQGAAVQRARRSIQALLDVRPDRASVLRDGEFVKVNPRDVAVNETIQVRVGERVPLDGTMVTEESLFNTSAVTGESRPSRRTKGESVLAGMINESVLAEIRVGRRFHESSLARILEMVQSAVARKAKTELFIRKFARVYTPAVVTLALALVLLPSLFVDAYNFEQWLYRGLIFLVVSCPCALVIAIPLGYFGGIGAGSRHGILFKGSNYLDEMTRIGTVAFDKTGTLTKGVFKVVRVTSTSREETEWVRLLAAVENKSNHPIAKAIVAYAGVSDLPEPDQVREIGGRGVQGVVAGKEVLAGNEKLFGHYGIPLQIGAAPGITTVFVAIDQKLVGHIEIADETKDESTEAIEGLRRAGINTVILSGDTQDVVDRVAEELSVGSAFGGLLPGDKVARIELLKREGARAVAFVGDGINDAPVLAASDVGIAMGNAGSDAAIETADVVIQTDRPSQVLTAIRIARATRNIVWQNIGLAFSIKALVLTFGAFGIASMWEAVFADVGVALLAIANAIRIQRMKF